MNTGSIYYAVQSGCYVLKCVGDVRLTLCASLDCHLEEVMGCGEIEDMLVDLTDAECIDSTTLGLIAKLAVKAASSGMAKPALVSTNEDVTRVLLSMGFDHVFVLLNDLPRSVEYLATVPDVTESDTQLQARILGAHRVLMSLNDSNREAFCDLVQVLECQGVDCS